MKKRKILVIVSIIICIFVCSGFWVYIWYINSPFVTVKKLMTSVKEKNVDFFIECIEPETAQKIQLLMKVTGVNTDDLIDILSDESDRNIDNNISIKISDYSRNDNKASIILTITNENGITEKKKINFIYISGSWYITIDFKNISL